MKKLGLFGLIVALIGGLGACETETQPVEPKPKLLKEEGIEPFKFSGEELYILESLQLQQQVLMLSYHAPEKARSMSVKMYLLNEALEWEVENAKSLEITQATQTPTGDFEVTELIGTLVLKYDDTYVDVILNNRDGFYQFWTESSVLKQDYVTSAYTHLHEFQDIVLNEEIPISITVFDQGTSIPAFDVFDFYTPQKFSELDNVQAITVTFSE